MVNAYSAEITSPLTGNSTLNTLEKEVWKAAVLEVRSEHASCQPDYHASMGPAVMVVKGQYTRYLGYIY